MLLVVKLWNTIHLLLFFVSLPLNSRLKCISSIFRDKLELKAVQDGSASYAALEKKAELYNKLLRGELSDEEDKEKYCVDFFRKGLEQDESQVPQGTNTSALEAQDIDGDDGGGFLLNDTKAAGLGRTSATVDRSQHKHFVM